MAAASGAPGWSTVDAYVKARGGNRPIKKVLIANNGIGAVKAIRSMRRWAFETFSNERAVQFVVMATPEDMRANAEYIRMADEIVDVPGGSNNNNYANVMLIVEIAERWNVDAVWAGWGHASENPRLPNSLAKTARNIVFIGPPGGPMHALGDKIGSTIIAQSAGVPCIGWNGDGLVTNYKESGIPPEVYSKANVTSAEQAQGICERLGFPVMIKASEGGGGKGIRKVLEAESVAAAFRQVASEVPGSPIFVMKLAPRSRHLEVQLLADNYGQAIALNGRDCSVQRRHQKIIEEGPPVVAPPDVWRLMEQAAISLAKEVGYSNAGTVEYLYTEEDHKFYFLELNPRLQVEHPVTEMITRVNLPAAQLQVAMGMPLHMIPDIRKLYGQDPVGTGDIDFDTAERLPPSGHCIAVRITAENPDQGFQPTSGTIQELNFRSTPDVWGYFSVDSSGLVHEFADSQFGHLFAGRQDRESARKSMIIALKELSIRGNIRTTVEYIADLMSSDDFIQNKIDTAWLDARINTAKGASGGDGVVRRLASAVDGRVAVTIGAVITAHQHMSNQMEDFCSKLGKGLLPPRELLATTKDVELIYDGVKYVTKVAQSGPQLFTVECGGSYVQAQCRGLADAGYLVIVAGKSHVVYANAEASGLRLNINGATSIFTKEYDPTCLDAEVAGKLARCLVPEGAHLNTGDPYAEIEVMKMFMPVVVKESGVIHWALSEGATTKPGDRLATLELDDPTSVTKAQLFSGTLDLPDSKAVARAGRPHLVLRDALRQLEMVMWGYRVPDDQYSAALRDLKEAICDALLPLNEFEEALSVLSGRIDARLFSDLKSVSDAYRAACAAAPPPAATPDFPVSAVLRSLDTHAESLGERDRAAFVALTDALRSTAEQYESGVAGRTVHALVALVRQYLAVERGFAGSDAERAMQSLRRTHAGRGELPIIYDMYRSHLAIQAKNKLLVTLLDDINLACQTAAARSASPGANGHHAAAAAAAQDPGAGEVEALANEMSAFMPALTEIGNLTDERYNFVAAKARALLIQQRTPSITQRRSGLLTAIAAAAAAGADEAGRAKAMANFVEHNVPMRDLLLPVLRGVADARVVAAAALEIYVRQTYRAFNISGFSRGDDGDAFWQQWTFSPKHSEALPPGVDATTSFVDLASLARTLSGTSTPEPSPLPSEETLGGDVTPAFAHEERNGLFAAVPDLAALPAHMSALLAALAGAGGLPPPGEERVNVLHIALLGSAAAAGAAGAEGGDGVADSLKEALEAHHDALTAARVRRVTFLVAAQGGDSGSQPSMFTFRAAKTGSFFEDPLQRDIEPSNVHSLELKRLANFAIRLASSAQATGGDVHLYAGVPKPSAAAAAGLKVPPGGLPVRYFARVGSQGSEYLSGGGKRYHVEKLFVEALSALDLALAHADAAALARTSRRPPPPANNHIFINCMVPDPDVGPAVIAEHMKQLMERFGDRIARLGVTHFEMKIICCLTPDSPPVPVRCVATNPTGFVVCVDTYVEARESGRGVVFRGVGAAKGREWEGAPINTPYPVTRPFEARRAAAAVRSDTLFCFDFLSLFEAATEGAWRDFVAEHPQARITPPTSVLHAMELVVTRRPGSPEPAGSPKGAKWSADEPENLVIEEVKRPAGQNDVGMVAWLVTLRTPEYPEGRQLVLIANDITFEAGSFGTREDVVFLLATRYARARGLPRIYLAANSGARIGLAESVKSRFRVAWADESDPALGYRYLYLTDEDYQLLSKRGAVNCKRLADEVTGQERWRLMEVVGEEPDLGVENLRGSGTIAGETSLAYGDVFTLTLVVGRSVGIGAYLVRLGQRTIQNVNAAPILLTGYQALNTLMGREVYASNDQLGGGQSVMFPNGVAHLLTETHMEAVRATLRWLSYVPMVRGSYLPVLDITGVDIVERPIDFKPAKGTPYDPRFLIAGHTNELDGAWVSGFFDRGSFTETLAGWAETVVCGRARLGGIPVGVVITESRTREKKCPADPADLTSQEKVVQQAGCVWFPDSAFKTAQAIRDLNGEGLPLMVFANWRGFSGGQRDMFDEILKFGAEIVDALVAYKQPVFVYIPPFAELRGGAWVVVDSTINPDVMEMYAADDARGGVLEANGAASIKFRQKDIIAAAHRLDPVLQAIDAKLQVGAPGEALTAEQRQALTAETRQREQRLMGVYQQLAVQFADLHDTPGRMAATGAVRKVVPWAEARPFFYWRLRRRLAEFDHRRQLKQAARSQNMSAADMTALLKGWFASMGNSSAQWDDDKAVLAWMAQEAPAIRERISQVQIQAITAETQAMLTSSPEAVLTGLLRAMQNFDAATKRALLDRLSSTI